MRPRFYLIPLGRSRIDHVALHRLPSGHLDFATGYPLPTEWALFRRFGATVEDDAALGRPTFAGVARVINACATALLYCKTDTGLPSIFE